MFNGLLFSNSFQFARQARAKQYADVISKALDYVKTTLDDGDIYSLAVACYAAHLAKHSLKTDFMQRLDKLAKVEGRKFHILRVSLINRSSDSALAVSEDLTSLSLQRVVLFHKPVRILLHSVHQACCSVFLR